MFYWERIPHKLKGGANLPPLELVYIDDESNPDECWVEFYISGLPDGYGDDLENIPGARVEVDYLAGEIQSVDAIFEQEGEEISDEEFMEQNQLDLESFSLLKHQIESYVKNYILDNWNALMDEFKDYYSPY